MAAALALASPTFASQIDIQSSPGGEPSLFDIANSSDYGNPSGKPLFTDLGQNSPQVNNAHWTVGGTGTTTSVLEATWTANHEDDAFGVYNLKDPSIRLNLLYGNSQVGANDDRHTKGFLSSLGNGNFEAYTQDVADPADVTNVQHANLGSSVFGYFLTIGGNTYFSDSQLNGGQDRMVGYQGDGSGSLLRNEYLYGWEDGSDNDFQDYVVAIESVRPVPEPSSIAMFGIGLVLIGFATYRFKKRGLTARTG
jgi:hypothetical protein